MDKKTILFLAAIVFFGFLLRFFDLNATPPSLNWDEVSHGYNAYSVLKTGKDQWGTTFPIFNFRAYGDYPTTLNLYLTIPFIYVLGLSDISIRLPHVILGTLTIISGFFVAYGLTKRKDISLFSAFLISIGPWYMFTSRFVLQSNVSVFLMSTALAFFLNRKAHRFFLGASVFFLFLSLFAYHTTRIVTPLLILAALVIYSSDIERLYFKSKKQVFVLLLSVFGLFLVSGHLLANKDARVRSEVLFILDKGAVNKIESQRNSSSLPDFAKKIIYNRPVYFISIFAKNYASYFTPKFLFREGGTQYQFSLPGHGLIPPVNLLFFYLGIVLFAVRSVNDKNYRLLVAWLLLYPIPASLTNETGAVLRATTLLPVSEILIATTIFWIYEKVPSKLKKVSALVYFIFIFIFMESYLISYFNEYRTKYSWSWQYGYKQISEYIKDNMDSYDKIVVTKKYGEPHEFLLFYLGWDPASYQGDKTATRFYQSGWYWVDSFDKFYFVNDWQIVDATKNNTYFIQESKKMVDCSESRCLLISSPGNAPRRWYKIKTVNFLDGSPAFEIFSNQKQ